MLDHGDIRSASAWVANAGKRAVLVLAVAAAIAAPAHAQQYKSDTPDAEARKYFGVAAQSIRNPGRFAQDRAQFEEYFRKFYFPNMTGTTPEDLGRLGGDRYDLFRRYLWATENEQLQAALTEIAFNAMLNIIKPQNPPYHPAVRYNAVITIGMLDEQYAREGANPRPPKPLPKATKALTVVVDSATTKDLFIPPVVLGAVIGLERHAQLKAALDPNDVKSMTAALLKLVNHSSPIQDMDRAAYSWLRLKAASALATLGTVGENNAVHDALIKLIADLRSLDDRCSAAALLAKINYEGAQVDGAATANGLFDLTRDLAAAESKRAQDFQDQQLGTGGGFIGQGIGMGTEAEQFPRRQALDRLADLRTGLQAVKPVIPEAEQIKVAAVVAAIDPVIAAAIDKNTVELRLTQAIIAMAEAINRALPLEQPAATDADQF